MKTLILVKNSKQYFFPYIINDGSFEIVNYWNSLSVSLELLFRISKKMKLPLINWFMGDWKKRISSFDNFILFDNGFSDCISDYIKSKSDGTIYLYYWNQIDELKEKELTIDSVDVFTTYSMKDSEKFGLKFVDTFYTKGVRQTDEFIISKDAYFLGRTKNRKIELNSIKEILEANQLNFEFEIIDNENEFKDYDYNLRRVGESKAIIDVVDANQSGLTLRVMESIYLKKKLITNSKDIENYLCFNPRNQLILDNQLDQNVEFSEFLSQEYNQELYDEIVDYYDIRQWKNRVVSINKGEH